MLAALAQESGAASSRQAFAHAAGQRCCQAAAVQAAQWPHACTLWLGRCHGDVMREAAGPLTGSMGSRASPLGWNRPRLAGCPPPPPPCPPPVGGRLAAAARGGSCSPAGQDGWGRECERVKRKALSSLFSREMVRSLSGSGTASPAGNQDHTRRVCKAAAAAGSTPPGGQPQQPGSRPCAEGATSEDGSAGSSSCRLTQQPVGIWSVQVVSQPAGAQLEHISSTGAAKLSQGRGWAARGAAGGVRGGRGEALL